MTILVIPDIFASCFRDIASAIKDLLDSVNEVLKTYQAQGKMREYRKVGVSVHMFYIQLLIVQGETSKKLVKVKLARS